MKRTPMPARKAPMRSKPTSSSAPARRAPISAKSLKRILDDQPLGPRALVREQTFQRDGYQCVARHFVPGVPCSAALQCDESQGRGREPGSHLDLNCTQSLCALCHRVKTDFPEISALIGLYGTIELERRFVVAEPADLPAALAEFAKRKAQVAGLRGSVGGDAAAVARFVAARGTEVPAEAWTQRMGS